MAVRDKSQSVGFVYTNIYEIYKKAKAADTSQVKTEASRILRSEDLGNVKITKFQPRSLKDAGVLPASEAAVAKNGAIDGVSPFDDLKSNLNKLQDLHSKLRFMLKELEDLVNKK